MVTHGLSLTEHVRVKREPELFWWTFIVFTLMLLFLGEAHRDDIKCCRRFFFHFDVSEASVLILVGTCGLGNHFKLKKEKKEA